MQTQNRFFDDLARVAAGAMGTLSGVKSEVETRIREQLERVLAGMDRAQRDAQARDATITDTEAVLGEAGYSAAEIAAMREEGVAA